MQFVIAISFLIYDIVIVLPFIIRGEREGLTIESVRKRSGTSIVEYPVAIVKPVKHPAAVRVHRMPRLRIRKIGWIHGRGTRRTRVHRMTEEPADDEEEGRTAAKVGRCILGVISRIHVLHTLRATIHGVIGDTRCQ